MLLAVLSFAILSVFVFLISYLLIGHGVDRAMNASAGRSNVPLDVVFVVAEKDAATLPYSVRSIRQWVKHPIKRIVVIGDANSVLPKIAKKLRLEFIDEDTLLSLESFRAWVRQEKIKLNHDSLGWYYQQFLKLFYYRVSTSDHYFVVDADIVVKQPMVLVSDAAVHTFFVGGNLGHQISKDSVQRLLGELPNTPDFSFIADLMCFDKSVVESLVADVESRFKNDFHKAALLAEQGSNARFSEYELYGMYANFVRKDRLASYLPKSEVARPRRKLWLDSYKLKLKMVPYIAYHYYLK